MQPQSAGQSIGQQSTLVKARCFMQPKKRQNEQSGAINCEQARKPHCCVQFIGHHELHSARPLGAVRGRIRHGRHSGARDAAPLGPDQSCLSRKTQAKAELRRKALKGRSTPPVPGVAKPEVILSFPRESGGTLRVTGRGFRRHDGKCSFSPCFGSTFPTSQLARKC